MRYLAYSKQTNKDCDCDNGYCQNVWNIYSDNGEDFNNHKEAIEKLKSIVMNELKPEHLGQHENINKISELMLFEVTKVYTLPIKDWYEEKEEREERTIKV